MPGFQQGNSKKKPSIAGGNLNFSLIFHLDKLFASFKSPLDWRQEILLTSKKQFRSYPRKMFEKWKYLKAIISQKDPVDE